MSGLPSVSPDFQSWGGTSTQPTDSSSLPVEMAMDLVVYAKFDQADVTTDEILDAIVQSD